MDNICDGKVVFYRYGPRLGGSRYTPRSQIDTCEGYCTQIYFSKCDKCGLILEDSIPCNDWGPLPYVEIDVETEHYAAI